MKRMKPCTEPGCPTLTKEGGYCKKHRKNQPRWQHEKKTAARGYGGAHRRWRRAVLRRDPLCVDCRARGRVAIATDADHIDGNPFNRALENGRGLCRKCHNRRTHGQGTKIESATATKVETPWDFA